MKIKFNDLIFYKYKIENWEDKKIALVKIYEKYTHHFYGNVITTWHTDQKQKNYLKTEISNFLHEEINLFMGKRKYYIKLIVLGFKNIKKDMSHPVHNHGSGYSAIVYIKYNPEIHFSTSFIDQTTDEEFCPDIEEGDIIFFDSTYNHFCGSNKNEEERIICSFNLKLNYN
jgi:ectoine hydroxylase-related dioxygenase (phytanoyl-CoA dioxygenase family)